MTYLLLDTETGGTDPLQHPLLQIGVLLLDDDLKLLEARQWNLSDFDAQAVDPKALFYNGLSIATLRYTGHDKQTVYHQLLDLIKHYAPIYPGTQKRQRLHVAGWNVGSFDVRFVHQAMRKEVWDEFCNYSTFEVQTVAHLCQRLGYLPRELRGLSEFAEYFGIKQTHVALDDAFTTCRVWEQCESLLKKGINKE